MPTSILLLSDLSYHLGIIGLAEMLERADIVRWLSEDDAAVRDPRGANDIESRHEQSVRDEDVFVPVPGMPPSGEGTGERKQVKREPPIIHFLALKRWYFTIGDPDCVPAVPDGHENAKTQKWPKLNPYTGRVFSDIHVEDVSRRLTRADMKALWRNPKFVEHCRQQVAWYADRYPRYAFPHARRGILVFPRW
jgi:hypothetical protein